MMESKTIKRLRPFTLADAQAVTHLFNACSRATTGHDEFELDSMINDWNTPGFDIEKTVRVLENEQGEIIGYIEVWDSSEPHVNKSMYGLLHPDHWDDDQYRALLSWAETCARERISLAPDGSRVVMMQYTQNKDLRRKKAMEAYGFSLVRHYYRMEIELGSSPQSPMFPEGIKVMTIDINTELKAALLALDDGFKDHWGHVERSIDDQLVRWQHYLQTDKDFDPTLWFLAKSEGQIVGLIRCNPRTVEDPQMGWVSQLCVRQPWRRQGLGMALLLMAFAEFHRRGNKRVGLIVDAASLTNATRLYEKAGMHIARQSDAYEFELRPGERLDTT